MYEWLMRSPVFLLLSGLGGKREGRKERETGK